jgi:hypothetical protein
MQLVVEFPFCIDLPQTVLRMKIVIMDPVIYLFSNPIPLQMLHQVIEVLNDTAFLRILTFPPQIHIKILLVVKCALQYIPIVKSKEFGTRYSTLNTQGKSEPVSHDENLLKILD